MTMKRMLVSVAAVLLALGARAPLAAQGVTTAAVAGRVLDESGAPVVAAQLILTNSSTGERYSTTTRDDGRYSFETVNVGGPYTLAVRALGFEPKTTSAFMLQLGQRFLLDVAMKRAAVEVAGVTVTAQANPLVSPERTGAQTFVSDTVLRRLPTLSRSFNDFISIAPQVVGRSFTGQNDRFNNVQIDGTVNNDLFSLGSSNGTPGGGVSARPISIEAVREYQVLVAPFDVRQGGFVGGLVNAVTQSGTNEFHGSLFGYMQNQNFVGKDTAGVSVPVPTYQQQQFGFSLGGPIIRDKLHFFVTGDFRHDVRPFASNVQIGPDPANPADTAGVGITIARADSVRNILINTYGMADPGTWQAPDINNPETNLFGKLDYELGTNSHLEVSGIFVNANQDKLIHNYTFPYTTRDGYELSNSGYALKNQTRTLRGKWTATFGQNLANEAIVGYTHINDNRPPSSPYPLILVAGNSPNTYLSAGAEVFSQANLLDQKVVEVTDNLTLPMGEHRITVGTHNEFIHFRNVFFPYSIGAWHFASPDSLFNGLPDRFQRALPTAARPDGPVADFNVKQFGLYAEDQFSPARNLLLTIGLRADVPSLPSPALNPTLDTIHFSELNGGTVRTSNSPTGNILWSPRVGFNYDLHGDQTTIIRGGVGIFSGRPPYVWVSNAFGNTGQEQATLVCTGTNTPVFTVDPNNQPATCADASGPSAGATSIVFYDPSFKFPQALKIALGADRALPWGMLGTVDFIFTKSVNQFYLQDVNIKGPQGTLAAEGGRVLYGTPNTTTGAVPVQRFTSAAADVIENVNKSADKSTSLTFQLQKRFSNNVEFNAAYTYSHTLDLISMTSDITSSNYRFAVLDGTVENRNLRTSAFDRPHKVTISGTVDAPYGVRLSLIYNGVSGSPFTYVVGSDVNGDGVGGNDPVYVPKDNNDISMVNPADTVALDQYINSESCLRNNRGRILPRNTCRNPWINTLNARLSKVFPTIHGQSVEIDLDILNLPNLLDSRWGLIRQTGVFEETNLLRVGGWDATNNRFKYNLSLPNRNVTQVNSIGSRWVMQLGARYAF